MERVTIGRALAQRRHALGLSTERAAAIIGVSRATYAAYERDARRLSVESLRDFAPFLDATDDEIVELYGATCVVQARMALLRDSLRDDDAARPRGRAAVSRDVDESDLAVVKRVYFDTVMETSDRETSNLSEFEDRDDPTARFVRPFAVYGEETSAVRALSLKDPAPGEPAKSGRASGKKSKKKLKKRSKKESTKNAKRKITESENATPEGNQSRSAAPSSTPVSETEFVDVNRRVGEAKKSPKPRRTATGADPFEFASYVSAPPR